MLLPLSASSSAQAPAFFTPAAPAAIAANSDHMVGRVMSFDRNGDGRVIEDELIERMKGLVAKGDVDNDGALDRGEIAALARRPVQSEARGLNFPMYQVPLDTWFPDRSHIEGALADLRLPTASYTTALTIVDTHAQHVDAVGRKAAGRLLRSLESVLTMEQLAVVQTALDGQGTSGAVTFHGTSGVVTFQSRTNEPEGRIAGSGADVVVRNAVLRFSEGSPVSNVRRIVRFSRADLARVVDQFGLPPDKSRVAQAAVDSYKATLRTSGEEERACLAEQMKDILSDGERDDFRAALARRNAVPTIGGGIVTPTVVRRGVVSVAPPIAAPALK
jgi:hypothetical protein